MDDDRLVTLHLCTELPGLNTSSIMFAPFECKVVIRAGSVGTRTKQQDTGGQVKTAHDRFLDFPILFCLLVYLHDQTGYILQITILYHVESPVGQVA